MLRSCRHCYILAISYHYPSLTMLLFGRQDGTATKKPIPVLADLQSREDQRDLDHSIKDLSAAEKAHDKSVKVRTCSRRRRTSALTADGVFAFRPPSTRTALWTRRSKTSTKPPRPSTALLTTTRSPYPTSKTQESPRRYVCSFLRPGTLCYRHSQATRARTVDQHAVRGPPPARPRAEGPAPR